MAAREGAHRRRVLPWLLVCLVFLAAAASWFLGPVRDANSTTPDVATAAPSSPPAPPSPAPVSPDDDPALPEPIRRYLAATPYPEGSGLLGETHTDLLEPNRRHERARPIPETLGDDLSQVVSSIFTADRYFYTSEEEVHAYLQVTRGGRVLSVRLLGASLLREGRAGTIGQAVPLRFRWENDRHALNLPLDGLADHHGPVVLSVHYEYAPGETYEESLRLFVTPADRVPARFTGEFEDEVVEGNLEIEIGLEVNAPGFYRFDANLYDRAGRPVAFTSFKGELGIGTGMFPLSFYGRLLRDAERPGPWVLGELRGYRFLEASFPDRERLPDYPDRFTTGDHPLEEFTDEFHVSDHERRMVELMLEDVARGISLDVPAEPDPP